jgi:8-oxo-dGTP diphosphatase
MIRYCVGFLFDGPGNFVALIKKNRPKWQAGLLNGVGGHVEDGEDEHDAMAREFLEEAGVDIPAERWRLFCVLNGKTPETGEPIVVHCFTARREANLKSLTDEPVAWYSTAVAHDGSCIPNLAWLIPMANDPNNQALNAVVDGVAR